MASCLVDLGRVAFFALIIIQGVSLASYPAQYEDKKAFMDCLSFVHYPLSHYGFVSCAKTKTFSGCLLFGYFISLD